MPGNRKKFESDPFGYSANAALEWKMMALAVEGREFDPYEKLSSDELKNPILWLSQAEALTQAAVNLLRIEPSFSSMPIQVRGICDSQFCAVGLMLVGYSLEVCLKGMLILTEGVDDYKEKRHHRLHELSDFIPNLTKKDRAILRGLTHFVYWAGRYPDPGHGKESHATEIFDIGEKYRICARDILSLAGRVMDHTKVVVSNTINR